MSQRQNQSKETIPMYPKEAIFRILAPFTGSHTWDSPVLSQTQTKWAPQNQQRQLLKIVLRLFCVILHLTLAFHIVSTIAS